LRAGLVEKPEEYRWNSLGYHLQAGNKEAIDGMFMKRDR
jgi:hypothetical protein